MTSCPSHGKRLCQGGQAGARIHFAEDCQCHAPTVLTPTPYGLLVSLTARRGGRRPYPQPTRLAIVVDELDVVPVGVEDERERAAPRHSSNAAACRLATRAWVRGQKERSYWRYSYEMEALQRSRERSSMASASSPRASCAAARSGYSRPTPDHPGAQPGPRRLRAGLTLRG